MTAITTLPTMHSTSHYTALKDLKTMIISFKWRVARVNNRGISMTIGRSIVLHGMELIRSE